MILSYDQCADGDSGSSTKESRDGCSFYGYGGEERSERSNRDFDNSGRDNNNQRYDSWNTGAIAKEVARQAQIIKEAQEYQSNLANERMLQNEFQRNIMGELNEIYKLIEKINPSYISPSSIELIKNAQALIEFSVSEIEECQTELTRNTKVEKINYLQNEIRLRQEQMHNAKEQIKSIYEAMKAEENAQNEYFSKVQEIKNTPEYKEIEKWVSQTTDDDRWKVIKNFVTEEIKEKIMNSPQDILMGIAIEGMANSKNLVIKSLGKLLGKYGDTKEYIELCEGIKETLVKVFITLPAEKENILNMYIDMELEHLLVEETKTSEQKDEL